MSGKQGINKADYMSENYCAKYNCLYGKTENYYYIILADGKRFEYTDLDKISTPDLNYILKVLELSDIEKFKIKQILDTRHKEWQEFTTEYNSWTNDEKNEFCLGVAKYLKTPSIIPMKTGRK